MSLNQLGFVLGFTVTLFAIVLWFERWNIYWYFFPAPVDKEQLALLTRKAFTVTLFKQLYGRKDDDHVV
jgi:hypothetical protein